MIYKNKKISLETKKGTTMKANTRIFGTIDIADDKIITMPKGMIGFPELTHFALIFNEEKKDKAFKIMWLQSMDDGDIAFPVIDPANCLSDYKPSVNEEMIAKLGNFNENNTYILVAVTVPKKVEEFSANLKAPIIINVDTNKGAQIITEDNYPIKYKLYELLKDKKQEEETKKAGE